MMGVEAATVSDAEHALRLLARIDHLLTPLLGNLHGLLAEHMLARLCGLDRMFGMECVRRDDIDHVDIGVVRHAMHIVIGIDAALGNVVQRAELLALLGRARDEPGQAAVPGLRQGRHDLMFRQVAESTNGKAELLARLFRRSTRNAGRNERRGCHRSAGRNEFTAIRHESSRCEGKRERILGRGVRSTQAHSQRCQVIDQLPIASDTARDGVTDLAHRAADDRNPQLDRASCRVAP